ncbi:MAG: hypothetical protein IKM03_07330 [Alistipes sp.]|nr:hypothetical protein [Alistipes sp.]
MNLEPQILEEENPIRTLFTKFPELNIRQVALAMGINDKLMQNYVSGSKRPSVERKLEVEDYIHRLGSELMKVKL